MDGHDATTHTPAKGCVTDVTDCSISTVYRSKATLT